MAESTKYSESNNDTVDVHIMDYSESDEDIFEHFLPTQNPFTCFDGQADGRGSGWHGARRSKRKKVSSGSTDRYSDTINSQTFQNLQNEEKLSYLYSVIFKNDDKITEVKNEQTTYYKTFKELHSTVAQLRTRVNRTERVIKEHTQFTKMLAYRSIDSEAKNRRNNLIVWGISERSRIRTDQLIMNFFEDEMSIDTSNIILERVYRTGSSQTSSYTNNHDPKRPVVIRFRNYFDTEKVMKNAYRLKGTPFGIDRDYPREIAMARKELYKSEAAKLARERRDKIQIRYPAKLYINGSLTEDKFPEWYNYITGNLMTAVSDLNESNDQSESDTECSVNSEYSENEEVVVPSKTSFLQSDKGNRSAQNIDKQSTADEISRYTNLSTEHIKSHDKQCNVKINKPNIRNSKSASNSSKMSGSKHAKRESRISKPKTSNVTNPTRAIYRPGGNPSDQLNMYFDSTRHDRDMPTYTEDGLVATEDCDTPF